MLLQYFFVGELEILEVQLRIVGTVGGHCTVQYR
jgi:hypothetical protein